MERWLSQPGPQKYFAELSDGFDPAFIEIIVRFGQKRSQIRAFGT